MIFKYELGFVAFTWPNLCLLDLSLLIFIVLVGRNFVSDIKLKPKNLKFNNLKTLKAFFKQVFSSPTPNTWRIGLMPVKIAGSEELRGLRIKTGSQTKRSDRGHNRYHCPTGSD